MNSVITVEAVPDLARMQRDRWSRLNQVMEEQGIDALVLLGNSNVSYATGARWALDDPGRANLGRPVAVFTAQEGVPHLFALPPDLVLELPLPDDHVHGPVFPEFEEGAAIFERALVDLLPGQGRIAVDELPGPMNRPDSILFGGGRPASADDVIGASKFVKTADELGFLRIALDITERAIAPVEKLLAPGVRQVDLTARFLSAAFDLGADANILDPIFQVMPARLADGPWTTHGDIACPLVTTERVLRRGDVLWVDTGISYMGFASDFGRTWIVGVEPTSRQRAQFRDWREILDAVLAVTRAGATGTDLTRAALDAADGRRPWMEHFYLGHGLGIDSAEAPFIGTDLGDAYDERQVLGEGTVLVLEPLVWDDGASGYRAEEVVAVTHDGWIPLTHYPYSPYAD